MATTAREHDGDKSEARALRHESRAGSTYAQFIRDVAERGGYTKEAAERYAVGTLTTLEERCVGLRAGWATAAEGRERATRG